MTGPDRRTSILGDLECSIPGFFGGWKVWQVFFFFGWLDSSRVFFFGGRGGGGGYSNQSEDSWLCPRRSSPSLHIRRFMS